jgi:hypothetical protein
LLDYVQFTGATLNDYDFPYRTVKGEDVVGQTHHLPAS